MSASRFLLAVLVVGSVLCTAAAPRALAAAARELAGDDEAAAAMASRHEKWMAEHGRAYKDEAEKARRLEVFRANAELIDSFNAAGTHSHRLATNRFADLTVEEFRAARTGLRRPRTAAAGRFRYENFSLADAAQSVDWRAMGAVTGVKDQGLCGTYVRTNDHANTETPPAHMHHACILNSERSKPTVRVVDTSPSSYLFF